MCRGVYKGRTWEQRLLQRETQRQLMRTHQFLEEKAWADEDEVFVGRKRRSSCRGNLAEARKVGPWHENSMHDLTRRALARKQHA